MQAALLYGPHDFRIEEKPDPGIGEDECLINIKACGVCHSEIHQWDVLEKDLEYPRFIGHEVAGEILKTGKKINNFKPGDRIAAWTDGKGYAEKISLKTDKLFLIDKNIPYSHALAEPIACTTNGIIKTDIQLEDTVALVGTGFMGLILLQQMKFKGPKNIIAIDIRDEMLELSKQLGADIVINPLKENVQKIIKDHTNGKGVDVSFEVGGVQSTLDLAAEICRMEGKLVLFGYHPGPREIKHLGYWNWMAFDIINAHFRNINTILRGSRIGMEMLNSNKINMGSLITHKFKLNEIEKAFTAAKEKPKGFVKSVIVLD
ncbi:MAG: zinc-binding dehydrogenase [Ignavibacteriaceae bacterium]